MRGGFDAASFAGPIVATGFFAVVFAGTAFFARIALYHRSTRFRDDILPVLNVENPGEVFVMSTANA